MSAAIIGGLLGSQTELRFSCPSPNCTYPDFTSLGASSVCEDVTAQTSHNCSISTDLPEELCTFQLPGNISLGAWALQSPHSGYPHTTANATTVVGSSIAPFSSAAHLVTISMITFGANNGGRFGSTSWRDPVRAHQCNIGLVAYRYSNLTVRDGKLHKPDIQMSLLEPLNEGNITRFQVVDREWPAEDVVYRLNHLDQKNIWSIFRRFMDNSVWASGSGELIAGALNMGPSIPEKFDMIATSITHYMMASSPNVTLNDGTMLTDMTYVRVRWAWLIPLAALVVMMWIFLSTAILFTKKDDIPVWKTSLYPLLMLHIHGDATAGEAAQPHWSLSRMEMLSRRQGTKLFSTPEKAGEGQSAAYTQLVQRE